ncbi:MAG: CPP1-like family protein [Cyanobacteria bacterium P01_D01_bin.123]
MNSESQADRSMDGNSPHQVLGIAQDASFEEIKAARDHLLQQLTQDEVQQRLVEQAYDAILMERLRLRQEGKIPIPDDIRNPQRAERTTARPSRWPLPSFKTDSAPSWANQLLDTPEPRDIWLPLAVMAGIYVLMLLGNQADRSLPLTLGFMATIYFIYVKERRFWRSLALALVGLILGLLLAQIPLALAAGAGTYDSAMTVGIALAVLWLCSAFLR